MLVRRIMFVCILGIACLLLEGHPGYAEKARGDSIRESPPPSRIRPPTIRVEGTAECTKRMWRKPSLFQSPTGEDPCLQKR